MSEIETPLVETEGEKTDPQQTSRLIRDVCEAWDATVRERDGVLSVRFPDAPPEAEAREEAETEAATATGESAGEGEDGDADATGNGNGNEGETDGDGESETEIAPRSVSGQAAARRAVAEREELIRCFGGARELALVFRPEDLTAERDLVEPGSFVLTAIDRFLRDHGQRAIVAAPRAHRADRRRALAAVGLTADAVADLARKDARRLEAFFVFRMGTDDHDRPQELLVTRTVEGEARVEIEPRLPLARLARMEDCPRHRLPADALAPLWERCREAAREEAHARVTPLHQKMLENLRRDIARIESFYRAGFDQLRRGSRDAHGARARELEEEMGHKIAELLAHRALRVALEPIQLVIVERPLARFSFDLAGRPHEVDVDLHDGAVLRPPCDGCGAPSPAVPARRKPSAAKSLRSCGRGHLVCGACAGACPRCAAARP